MRAVVLEHPRLRSEKRFNDIANTPLWSCLMGGYAASSLSGAGFDAEFIDASSGRWTFEKTRSELSSLSPDLICINAIYMWENAEKLFQFISGIKSDNPQSHIALFGFFPTLAYRVILENIGSVDSIAAGECEHSLVELARSLKEKNDLRHIPGIAVKNISGVELNSHRLPEKNPDVFPFPNRKTDTMGTVSILGSRGCYNHCTFCPVPSFYNDGPLWRGRSPENILKEMTQLKNAGHSDFYFIDPNFIGPGRANKERTLKLLDHIKPLQITFGMETRPNDLDPELLEKLILSGCGSLLLGVESGSPPILESLNKRAGADAGEEAIKMCRASGIDPEIGFLMFVPDSAVQDIQNNFNFLLRNDLLDRLDRTLNLLSHSQLVLMGTSGYKHFMDQGRLRTSGFLGFEGEIDYVDERVRWMSEIVTHLCLSVLKEMSLPDSTLYWKKDNQIPGKKALNAYIVKQFENYLSLILKRGDMPEAGEIITDIDRGIKAYFKSLN